MDEFAPYLKKNGCFIVRNVTPDRNKTIRIFQYPINYLSERDLLQIPGVAEDDIRASLLKGELRHKILAQDIIVICSDIDLLQFNDDQLKFLESAGINIGLQISANQMNFLYYQDIQLIGLVNDSNTIFKIPNNQTFIQDSVHRIIVYRNGVKQFYNDDYMIAESGGIGTGYNTVIFSIPPTAETQLDIITADYYVKNIVS